MKTARTSLALVLAVLTAAGSAFADQQTHALTPQQLTAAMTAKIASEDADRAAIREALARPQVRDVAASMGVDLARLNGAVDTMTGADLDQAASTARQVNQELVGGVTTVALTATTIIIILLVVIIIVLLAK
jgi:branched-subunit amino acid ABC-type transport system permease component